MTAKNGPPENKKPADSNNSSVASRLLCFGARVGVLQRVGREDEDALLLRLPLVSSERL